MDTISGNERVFGIPTCINTWNTGAVNGGFYGTSSDKGM